MVGRTGGVLGTVWLAGKYGILAAWKDPEYQTRDLGLFVKSSPRPLHSSIVTASYQHSIKVSLCRNASFQVCAEGPRGFYGHG